MSRSMRRRDVLIATGVAGLTAEAPTAGAPNRYSTSRTARP